jgi:hypothetical protein
MIGAKIDYKVEPVTRAFDEATSEACLWDNELAVCKEQFRKFARNAIKLLNEDIGVLLLALENPSAKERMRTRRLAAYNLARCSLPGPHVTRAIGVKGGHQGSQTS